MSELKDKLFKGVPKPEQIEDALRRRDVSYIRGVIQFYRRENKRESLISFLEQAILHFKHA